LHQRWIEVFCPLSQTESGVLARQVRTEITLVLKPALDVEFITFSIAGGYRAPFMGNQLAA